MSSDHLRASYSAGISFGKYDILSLRFKLTSNTLTRRLTCFVPHFGVFWGVQGCQNVCITLHSDRLNTNPGRRPRRTSQWSLTRVETSLPTVLLRKKSHYMVNHTSTSNPQIRCHFNEVFGGIQINDPNHVKNRYDRREVPVLPCQSNI